MAMAVLCGAKCLRLKRPQVNDYASLSGLYGVRDVRRGKAGENRRGRDRAREFERLQVWQWRQEREQWCQMRSNGLNSTGDCP